MSEFNKFIRGKTKNNLNVAGLMFLVALLLPSLLLDAVWIRMYLSSGQAWDAATLAVNFSPYFGLWGFFTLSCNAWMLFVLVRSIRSTDKRIADDGSLKEPKQDVS